MMSSEPTTLRPLIVCDLDGVAVNNEKRAALAQESGTMDWAAFYNPDWIRDYDVPMEAGRAILQAFARQGYQIWYVSSREVSCAAATMLWLYTHKYPTPRNLHCRPKFMRTVEFKATTVRHLHDTNGPVVLFVDDDERNRTAVAAEEIAGITICATLDEAQESLL